MKEVYEFIKKCEVYYLATTEGDQPRVRPFGTANIFEDKLYIQMGRVKKVSQQLSKNPKIEICAFDGKSAWLRLQAVVIEDNRREPKVSMLNAYPELKDRYSPDDSNTQVFYLKNAVATIETFGGKPKEIKF